MLVDTVISEALYSGLKRLLSCISRLLLFRLPRRAFVPYCGIGFCSFVLATYASLSWERSWLSPIGGGYSRWTSDGEACRVTFDGPPPKILSFQSINSNTWHLLTSRDDMLGGLEQTIHHEMFRVGLLTHGQASFASVVYLMSLAKQISTQVRNSHVWKASTSKD